MAQRRILVGVLGAVGVLAIAFYAYRMFDEERPATAGKPGVGDAALAEIRGYIEAEKSTDLTQLCLGYPDPPAWHWQRKVTDAFCHQLDRRAYTFQAISARLEKHETDELRKVFDGYSATNYQPGQHGYMIWAYARTFEYPNAEVGTLTDQWIAQDPQSAYALAARGLHRVAAAYAARGTGFAIDTKRARFMKAYELAEMAREDLNAALARDPKLIVAYHGLIELAKLESDRDLLESATRGAMALDPADQAIYQDWLDALEPRWGGSIAAMQAVVDQALAHASENPLLEQLRARTKCYQAEMLVCSGCGPAGTLQQRAREALGLLTNAASETPAQCLFQDAEYSAGEINDNVSAIRFYSQGYRFSGQPNQLFWRAQALQKIGKGDWALDSLDRLLQRQPRNPEVHLNRGYLLDQNHRAREAEQAFAAALAIDPTSWDARRNLVHVYVDELHEPQKARAIIDTMKGETPRSPRVWLLEAATHKNGEERQCRDALRQYLAEVDPNTSDPVDRREIGRVRQRLGELDRQLGN